MREQGRDVEMMRVVPTILLQCNTVIVRVIQTELICNSLTLNMTNKLMIGRGFHECITTKRIIITIVKIVDCAFLNG